MWKKYIRKIVGTEDEFVSFDTDLGHVPQGDVPADHTLKDGDYIMIGVTQIPVKHIKRIRLMCEETMKHWFFSPFVHGVPVDQHTGIPIEFGNN